MGLADKIVTRVEHRDKGWYVKTQGGFEHGPFKTEEEMAADPRIGQRAMNWLAAQGGRNAPPRTSFDGFN